MRYTVEHRDEITILSIHNQRVEGEVSAKLKAEVLIAAQPDIEGLIIDLTAVEMLDSSGLGALLLANRQLKEYGIPLALVGVKEMVLSLMKISQIDGMYDFFDTIEDVMEEWGVSGDSSAEDEEEPLY
jgi:anti-sigma B factor antagonist